MNKKLLLDNLRCIPDWPVKGVNFRDVTTLFKSPEALQEITDEIVDLYKGKGVTKIVGIDLASSSSNDTRSFRTVVNSSTRMSK